MPDTHDECRAKWEELLRSITETLCGWRQIWDWFCRFQGDSQGQSLWLFRGEADSTWTPKTTLERALEDAGGSLDDALQIERELLREFQRKTYAYLTHLPAEDDHLQWLALMQHYGAPTRLLDATYSFFVALFFAVAGFKPEEAKAGPDVSPKEGKKAEHKSKGQQHTHSCSVLAVDSKWLSDTLCEVLPNRKVRVLLDEGNPSLQKGAFHRVLMQECMPFVVAVNPFRLNDRLTAQQGVFLCPGDVTKPFVENLLTQRRHRGLSGHLCRLKIVISREERNRILRELHQMNATRAAFFPGLQGFAESLTGSPVFLKHFAPKGASAGSATWR